MFQKVKIVDLRVFLNHNADPGTGQMMRIPDPKHCFELKINVEIALSKQVQKAKEAGSAAGVNYGQNYLQ